MALRFDTNKNILYAYRNECAIPDVNKAYQLNTSVYENAQKYYKNENFLKKEIETKWFPAFQRMLNVTDEQLALDDIQIREQSPEASMSSRMFEDERLDKIDYNTKIHQKGSKTDHYVKYDIYVKFKIKGFNTTQYINIMSIPWVREDGIIEYNGAEYAFIHMLEQTDGISYNPNNTNNKPPKITLRTNRNNISIFNKDKEGIMVEIGKSTIEMISIVSAVLRKEVPTSNLTDFMREVWDQFADGDILNIKTRDEHKFIVKWFYGGGSTRRRSTSEIMEQIAPKLCGLPIDSTGKMFNMYDTTNLREQLNELLSLRQALNKKLARPVYNSKNELLARKGEIVTDYLIDKFNRNGIYILYVENDINLDNAVLAKDVITPYIPSGSIVTDELEEAFPEENGMYSCKDYYSRDYVGTNKETIFMIDKGTILNKSHIERIKLSEEGIYIQTGKNKISYVSFITEIISNKQFKGEWIEGCQDPTGWYYLNVDSKYERQLGVGYTAYDMIALWSYAVKALRGKPTIKLPNIDEDFRKELIPINEQFSRAMNYSITNGMKQMKQTFNAYWKSDKIVMFTQQDSELVNKFYAFERLFWEYLVKESKCVRMIPTTALNNPIAYISEVTKANVYTATKNSVSDSQRTISIGSYGKIDPHEIPQSGKIGVVNNLCSYVNIDDKGRIKTPYYKVRHKDGKSYVAFSEGYYYMTVEEEEKHIIADICSMDISNDGLIEENQNTLILCMVPGGSNNRRVFDKVQLSKIEFVNINAMQTLSWASSTIPFLCNNDAARAVFAVAQMKQAKGLEYPEEPLVMTSAYEMIPKLNRKFGYVCNKDEYLTYTSKNNKTDNWCIMTANNNPELYPNQPYNECVEYQEFRQGDNSVMTIKPVEFLEDTNPFASKKVSEGDTIVASNFISENGILQFGVNAFTLFIPDGHSYEDSAKISEDFSRRISSYRINEELLPVTRTSRMPRIKDTKEHSISTSVPFEPNTDNDTFTLSFMDYAKGKTQITRKIKHAYGTYIGQYGHIVEGSHPTKYDGVVVQLLSRDYATKGDKLSNRHGNKCTISKVSSTDVPFIKNGRQADILLNPLGVGSRMNIGQIKELTLGLIMHVLGIKISSDAYNCISDVEIKILLEFAWSCANETTLYKELPEGVPYPSDLEGVINRPEFSEIPAALKEIAKRNIDRIQQWRDTFDKNGAFDYYYLEESEEVDEAGEKIIVKKWNKTKAVGGFLYIFKLTQESHKKVHSRANDMADEEYAKLTDAPTQGAARGGGQRMGTMENAALCAYDAKNYIHELFNIRSDNAIARENFNLDTYFSPKLAKQYKKDSKGQRRAVTELLYLLLSLGIMTISDNGEIIPLSRDNGNELGHVKGQYIQRKLGRVSKFKNEEDADENECNNEVVDDSDIKFMANSFMSKISYSKE